MFVDAAAIVAILAAEAEAERCAAALLDDVEPITSPIAVWEAAIALARPDKLALPLDSTCGLVLRYLEERGIAVRDLPNAPQAVSLALDAARRYRRGRTRLNLADCFHYACARHYGVPILSTADKFRFTDIEAVP